MHSHDNSCAKLKTFWAKLTKHRYIRANTKTTLKMILRSQKAKVKASGAPSCNDDSLPPTSKPTKNESQEEDKEMLDDVQDPDEDMGDCDKDSEEDEGSLYSPTEGTNELDGEEAAGKLEDLMELSFPDPCKFLLLLPRELRDKIYGYVLSLGAPMSHHRLKLKCTSCPSVVGTANSSILQSHVYEACNLLRTCHQIRDEGSQVFYEVNSWGLHRVRLRDMPVPPSVMDDDTERMYERLGQIEAIKHIQHVNMQITLSPLAYCDFAVPDSVALDDPLAIQLFEMSQHPTVIGFHKLQEPAQCEMFRTALKGLVKNQTRVFPKLRSITLDVSFHEKKLPSSSHIDPLDRCGITFYVRIKLGHRNRALPTTPKHASLPAVSQDYVVHNPHSLQRAKYKVHGQKPHPNIPNDPWIVPLLDPRRHMLSPLRQLHGVQSVEVERRWTVHYRQRGTEDGNVVIRIQPLRQLWRFRNVGEMLEEAGHGFGEFFDPGMEALKISQKDVIEIIENTIEEDIEYCRLP